MQHRREFPNSFEMPLLSFQLVHVHVQSFRAFVFFLFFFFLLNSFICLFFQLSMSNASQVVLRNVGFGLSGNFSCEVTADAPSFSTRTAHILMQVVGKCIKQRFTAIFCSKYFSSFVFVSLLFLFCAILLLLLFRLLLLLCNKTFHFPRSISSFSFNSWALNIPNIE